MASEKQHKPGAFLSYAHADDHERGITRFVEHLNREISLHLGKPFEIFLDRADLSWGDNWKRRINESLDSVTFLIAVLSPSFLTSQECVREVERFLERERKLERDDLVFPVVWIEPDEVPDERRELWELLWKRQNTNWERFRHYRSRYPVTARREIEKLARAMNKAIRSVSGAREAKAAHSDSAIETSTPPRPKVERPGKEAVKAPAQSPPSPKRSRASAGPTSFREGAGVVAGLPDILWRPIPEGEVEISGHSRFHVEPFHMAAFPVTNAQFQAFLDATDGHGNDRWWEGLSLGPNDRTAKEARWKEPDHPRETVSWFEAVAFCRWLTDKLGLEVRLPDEQEWQWAAQSANPAFAYPWGPDWRVGAANTREAGLGRTSAVTAHQAGHSRQGVADLAGNVWEWCRNNVSDPRNTQMSGRGPRVLRGGSWDYDRRLARADGRSFALPSLRGDSVGFRVVCSSPIR